MLSLTIRAKREATDRLPSMGRSKAPAILAWIVAAYSLVFVAGVSWLDAGCFFELWYPLRWGVAAVYLTLALPLLSTKSGRTVACGSLIWMLALLPQMRWNHAKSFYVDARRLELGMEAAEVRKIMAPHLELGVTWHPTSEEREWLPLPPDPRYAMMFIHCAIGWTDHCEVKLDAAGKVRKINIVKD